MRLEGKSVVVTGASAGMGQAIVERFAAEGANVVAVARRMERLEELAASLKDAPGRVVPFAGDIGDPKTAVDMIDKAIAEFGRLDILVNNAGIMDDNTAVGDVSDEMLERLFRVNTYGPIYAMRKAVKVFMDQAGEDYDEELHRLRQALDLHRGQPVHLLHRLVGLGDGDDDFGDIKNDFGAISLDDFHFCSSL